ncbi:MAG TPA: hypothetical protein VFK03_03585 [Candidatus Saccharimonadales bacterium]|nr:hypothetical protein [Candidatus Saccharimonadales bacterium]
MEGWRVRQDCGVCRGFVKGAECRRLDEDTGPTFASEQLCVLSLAETLQRNRENNYIDNLNHVWTCLESSLASTDYPTYSGERLDEAFVTLDQIIASPASKPVEVMEAISLKNFAGMFRARATDQPITNQLVEQTRDDIGALICTIDEIDDAPPQYDNYVSGFMAEQIVTWLALYADRPELALYPSSQREGHNDLKRLNHDRYLLDRSGKVLIEIKRRHRHRKPSNRRHYDKPVNKIVLEDILAATASKHGRTRSRRDNFLIDCIRCHMTGRPSRKKVGMLNTASRLVVDRLEQARVDSRQLAKQPV